MWFRIDSGIGAWHGARALRHGRLASTGALPHHVPQRPVLDRDNGSRAWTTPWAPEPAVLSTRPGTEGRLRAQPSMVGSMRFKTGCPPTASRCERDGGAE